MSKAVKEMTTRELTTLLKGVTSLVVCNSKGISAKDDNSVRRTLNSKQIQFKVVKNSLAKRALNQLGVKSADPLLSGPSAIAFGRDVEIKDVANAVLTLTKKIPQLQIKGGLVEGEALDAKGMETVATGPGRKEYIGRVAALAMGPAGRLMALLQSASSNLLGQIRDVEKKAGEAPAQAPAAPAAS